MKKRILALFLAVALTCALLPATLLTASAETYSGTCGENLAWTLDTESGVLTISGTGEMEWTYVYDIPWRPYQLDVKQVVIGDGVTNIGDGAFWGCTNIASVTLPNSITTIEGFAFTGCSELPGITLPANLESIGDSAFAFCSGLSSIAIPSSVKEIGRDAFGNCTELNAVYITDLSAWCAISFHVDDSLDSNPLFTAHNLYLNDTLIRDLVIPDGVTSICDYAFMGAGFTSATIGNEVTHIGIASFDFCHELTSVTIGSSVTSIGENAFFFCFALTDVYYSGTESDWNAISIDESNYLLTGANIHFASTPSCAHEHAYPEHEDATCTEPGYDRMICDECGEVISETILPALGHDLVTDAAVPATCTASGLTAGEHCTRCDYKVAQEVVPALGHSWNDGEITKPATETEDGVKTFTCTVCGATKTEVIPATGEEVCKHEHGHNDHMDATCTEDGYDRMICDDCGKVISEELIAALGHNVVKDEAVPATCTATGLTAGEHCTRCNYKVAQEVVPMLAHSFKDGVCTVCGAKDPNYKPAEPTKFNDVAKTAWYYDAVNYAVQNGLMNGVGGGNFAPDSPMTRAMLVTVLWRYEGSPEEGKNTFTDVPNGEWYTKAVAWAAANGIVSGVGNGKFDPNGNITREQMAAILFRYADKKGFDTSKRGDLSGFPDRAKVSGYATDAIAWTVAEKIIGGSDGKLLPQGNATRAQVSTILMRFIEGIAK